MNETSFPSYDYILIGGGLQSGLLALALRHYRPSDRVLILEAADRVGGNHTWCCHAQDLPPTAHWSESLFCHEWEAFSVRFPGLERTVRRPYRCVTSEHFEQLLRALSKDNVENAGGVELRTNSPVTHFTGQTATTQAGDSYVGKVVIDCRGPHRSASNDVAACGYQKFLGMELELESDWPDQIPVMMDAETDQQEGFRFCYVLPFSPRRILVEDTYFSDQPELDRHSSYRFLDSYVRRRTRGSWTVLREEAGCLPMPMTMSQLPGGTTALAGGYAGGWFHAATGYSLPLAARFADAVAAVPPEQVPQAVASLAASHRSRARFSRFLNRMLFRLVRPETRWQVFQRFFRVLSDDAVCRFFAHQFTALDAAKMVIGRPPGGLTPFRFLQSPKPTCTAPSVC